jgi:hypothetical protein
MAGKKLSALQILVLRVGVLTAALAALFPIWTEEPLGGADLRHFLFVPPTATAVVDVASVYLPLSIAVATFALAVVASSRPRDGQSLLESVRARRVPFAIIGGLCFPLPEFLLLDPPFIGLPVWPLVGGLLVTGGVGSHLGWGVPAFIGIPVVLLVGAVYGAVLYGLATALIKVAERVRMQ